MNDAFQKLTIYFGERDRVHSRFVADALSELYAHHQLQASLVMRGVEGFGLGQVLRTDRLLTLSEDLPLVSVAVDSQPRIEAALADVQQLPFDGLVTVERARMLAGPMAPGGSAAALPGEVKLTVYVGRHQRVAGRSAYEAVVDLFRRRGIAGATVLLGVDGTAGGVRRRARFFGANTHVPLMVIAVGEARRMVELLPELDDLLTRPLVTLERVRVCKRDGRTFADPHTLPETDRSGLGVWQKLMVYSSERARPSHHELIRALRREGAAGATSLRGIWGFSGDHPPHGDVFWQLQRRVPIVTVIIDTPKRIAELYAVVDAVTRRTGLVTSEVVPAFRATGPTLTRGGLTLARLDR